MTIDNTGFDGCCVMTVDGKTANVTLSLEGENTFTAGGSAPCITVSNDSTLTIAGGGSVTAQGGDLYGCAGISVYCGNIIISGGTVNTIGGETEIDGIVTSAIAVNYGSITVSGGTVNAIGGTVKNVPSESSGIFARNADIIISGGTVNANGEDMAADENRSIGINAESGSITISGGEVNATGGAVTGNHCWSWGIHVSNSDLTMSNGKVNANGGKVTGENSQSSGIYVGGDIVINGGTVEAAGGAATGKDGIISGIYADGDITVSVTADVTARGGDIPLADNAGDEATAMVRESYGIFAQGGDVTINGGTLEAAGGNNAAWSMGINSRGVGTVTVNGGTLNAAGGHAKYTAMQSCAVSYGISGGELTVNGGTVTVNGGDVYGNYPESLGVTVGQVAITAGAVNAEGGAATAQWGSATSCAISSSEKIKISDGIVTAEGGNATFVTDTLHDPSDCANSFGIRSWRAIEISGGTLEAAGGAADTESNGIKIQYNYYPDYGEFDGGYLTVSGGEVNATGGAADNSLGICARVYRYDLDIYLAVEPGTIAITGGRVIARTLAGEGAEVRMAMNAAPSLPDVYCWRTAETAAFTASDTPYTFNYAHTYVEFIVGHILTKAEAKAATCTEAGNSEYWTCSVCGKYFSDKDGKTEIVKDSWKIAATGHTPGEWEHDSTEHWCCCTVCAAECERADHTFSGGTCTVCGYTKVMPFVDVPNDAYYFDAVLWAVENGITNGTSDTTFSPDASCTRAQAVTFLWRAVGCPSPKSNAMPFKDVVKGSYYETAVLWAVENGITNGTSATTFSPDSICSRAQIATFLWRSQGMPDAGTTNPFTDVTSGEYYYDAVLWAVENGITNGTSSTTFSPNENCTRAQIVTFLYRCLMK
ncbi:MAG: S-layer homology domain-containing protein [Faecousia sp.]